MELTNNDDSDLTRKIELLEEKIRQLEEKAEFDKAEIFSAFFSNAHTIQLIIDPTTGQIRNANHAACQFYGYSHDEFINLNISNINILPPALIHQNLQLVQTDSRNYFQFKHKLKSGEIKDVEVYTGRMIFQQQELIISVILDITHRTHLENELVGYKNKLELLVEQRTLALKQEMDKRVTSENALRESEAKYRNLIDYSTSIVLEWDTDGCILFINKYGLDFFGYTQNELFGKHVIGTIVNQYDENGFDLQEKMRIVPKSPEEFYSSENENIKKNGEKVWIAWTNKGIYDTEGKLIKTLSVGIDRTIQHNLEKKLLAYNDTLEENVSKRTRDLELINQQLLQEVNERKQMEIELIEARNISEKSKSELILAQNELARSEQLLKDIQSISKTGGWEYIIESQKMYWTPELFNIHEIEQHPDIDHISESVKCYFPEDRERIMNAFKLCMQNGIGYDLTFPFVTRKGNKRWIRTKTEPFYENGKITKVIGTLIDITQQKETEFELVRAKEEAEENEARQKALLDNAIFPITLTTAAGQILYVNEAAIQFFEFNSGIPLHQLDAQVHWVNPEKRQIFVQKLIENGKEVNFENQFRTGIGKLKTAMVSAVNIKYLNEKVVFAIYNDITERINLENQLIEAKNKAENISSELAIKNQDYESINEELRQTNEALKYAKEKAEESDRLKSSFLQNMSHEVRTPLNAIYGFSQLMAVPNMKPAKLQRFSELISENSQKLIDIITDVIEISQIEIKQTTVKFEETNLFRIINNIVENFEEKAKLKNISILHLQDADNQNNIITTDAYKVKRIIWHLLDNAIKFTHRGFVSIICNPSPTHFQFTISDSGIGISPETQKYIFDPFRQVETGLSRHYGGNGLGLALVKAYIEMLHGNITLESEINKGTSFIITIPNSKTLHTETVNLVSNQKNKIETVLIVEDEYSNFLYLEELFSGYKINILYAENGLKAIETCRENVQIDLIMMDIKMPIMDGYTAAKMIKEFRKQLPIIAQSAYALDSEIEKYVDVFDDYITKPIHKDIFTEKMNKYII